MKTKEILTFSLQTFSNVRHSKLSSYSFNSVLNCVIQIQYTSTHAVYIANIKSHDEFIYVQQSIVYLLHTSNV